MAARRCSSCSLNYEDNYAKFKTCLKCGEKTDSLSNAKPMSDSELNHLKFDVYCAKRDAEAEAQTKAFEAALEATPSIPDPDEPASVASDEKPEGD